MQRARAAGVWIGSQDMGRQCAAVLREPSKLCVCSSPLCFHVFSPKVVKPCASKTTKCLDVGDLSCRGRHAAHWF